MSVETQLERIETKVDRLDAKVDSLDIKTATHNTLLTNHIAHLDERLSKVELNKPKTIPPALIKVGGFIVRNIKWIAATAIAVASWLGWRKV